MSINVRVMKVGNCDQCYALIAIMPWLFILCNKVTIGSYITNVVRLAGYCVSHVHALSLR